METIKLNIKNDSVEAFMRDYLLYPPMSSTDRRSQGLSPYNYMSDELLLKKECGLTIGQVVNIEIHDMSEKSRKSLVNKYTYEVIKFDDVAHKLFLVDFKIELEK